MNVIRTERVDPPIATTMFDWVAYVEGQEDQPIQAYGPSEAEALRGLAEALWDIVRMAVPQ